MELWQLLLIIGTLLATLVSFIWLALKISTVGRADHQQPRNIASEAINETVNQAFSDEFREDLRQRARTQFEKIIHDNAMFLQQDVRMSAAQLDDFMKKQIYATLQQELAAHNKTAAESRQMLSDAVVKSQAELKAQINSEKERRLAIMDSQLTEVVKKYVLAATANVMTTDQQIALIIDNLNARRAEIIEEIRRAG